ncbi:MAG TPA: hypothetical protein VM680_06935 [Verrucomicrobiae bacterium]|nr:hypothetical protein [Verrucomicrobiae bacterium]
MSSANFRDDKDFFARFHKNVSRTATQSGETTSRWSSSLADMLPEHGVKVGEIYAEDWGWGIPIENEAFRMFIACGNVTWEGNMVACSIWPSKREVRKGLFRKVSAVADVERVAEALDRILRGHAEISEVDWEEG